MSLLRRGRRFLNRFRALPERITRLQQALGRIEQRQLAHMNVALRDAEFRVFSQWGEDGIIQYLVAHVPIERPIFVEFGVEDYVESNTRFLLTNNQWSGLVLDGSAEHIDYIRQDPIYWAANLKAEAVFLTADNVDAVISANGVKGDIGLLSIDVDGNDYWLWKAIQSISPRIVVCEYNSHWGATAAVSTPYDPAFRRESAHFSKVYYGASLAALWTLGRSRGYSLVTANNAGNNAFFVRDDVLGSLEAVMPADVYRRPVFREFHDEQGRLTFDDFDTRLRKISHLDLQDVVSGERRRIADIFGVQNAV